MAGEFDGKVAVVSGGSGGIGRVITRRLASGGCDCLIAGLDEPAVGDLVKSIAADTGRRIETCLTDLRTAEGCQAVYAAAKKAFDHVDILINVAGATKGGDFLEQTDAVWEDGFALKFYSSVRLSRLFWRDLSARQGTIVSIAGGFARMPAADFLIGGAVNAALANFTKGLSKRGLIDDVNVNAIHPGMVVTDRHREIMETRAKAAGTTMAEIERQAIEKTGIRRLARPEEVAELVAYLCSPMGRHIQGTVIAIDGGENPCLY